MTISLIRTLFLYLMIILAVRIMGKRQISELQTSELVVTLLISDIAAIPMQNTSQPLVSGFIPILVLVSCELLLSASMLKNSKFRKLVCGKPIIVIKDGEIDQKEMRRLRMSTEDLSEQLRQMDVFNISEVSYAIVETNGKLSVLKKPENQQPTNSMLGIVAPDDDFYSVVVSDGEISEFSASLCGVSNQWIDGVLKAEKLNLNDVFIMTVNKSKDYYVVKKEDKK